MKPQRHAALLLLSLTLGIIPARAQEVHLHGFMDFTASASTRPGSRSAFGLGQYDFYLTAQLAEHISFLGESVFEYDGGFIVDVERVLVAFTPRHYFHVVVGKHHTPIGYWNTAYHHGALMQPTIARAQMFRFEDEGGVLPIHTTGVLISGRDISRLHLGYDVMVGNGIGSTPTEDNDNAKSYTFAAHSQVNSRLRIGASVYLDRIAPGTPDLSGTPVVEEIDVRMFGGFVAYSGRAFEFLGEYQRTNHRIRRTGVTRGTDAYYGYGGYRLGKLVPYLRYDELKFPADDPYFVVDDFRQSLLGVRYDLAATVGVKLELARRTTAIQGSATVVTAQVAVGF